MKKLLFLLLFFTGITCQAQNKADIIVIVDTVYLINSWSGDTIRAYKESYSIKSEYYDSTWNYPTKRITYFNPFEDMSPETVEFILTHYNQKELKQILSPVTWRDNIKKSNDSIIPHESFKSKYIKIR